MGVDQAPLPCLHSASHRQRPVGLDPTFPFPCVHMTELPPSLYNALLPLPLHVRGHSGKNQSLPTGKCEAKPERQGATLGMKSGCLGSGLWFCLTCVALEPPHPIPKSLAL